MSIRVRETYGTSWRGTRPGTRHWRSTSVSFGLGSYLLGYGIWSLFVIPLIVMWWLLLAELWVCAEMLLLTVSLIVVAVLLAQRRIGLADLALIPVGWRLFAIGTR